MTGRADRIVKVAEGWQVQSESGKPLGTYETRGEAEARLRQVEMFKHMRKDVVQDYQGLPRTDSAQSNRRHG